MKKHNETNNTETVVKKKYGVSNTLVNYYLALMFTVFPLFFTEKFTNIRHDKLHVYLVLSCVLILSVGVTAVVGYFEKKRVDDLGSIKSYFELSVTDIAFGALIIVYVISTLLSKVPMEAFTGDSGRNNGLMIFIFYFLVYIIISRLYQRKEFVFICLAAGSLAVYLLDILNFFYIDIFEIFISKRAGMFYGYDESVVKDFTSTIGNKNIMSAFCCLTIPILIMLYMTSKKKYLKYLYLASGGVGFAAMLCADSESGFLGLVPLLMLMFLFYSRNITMLRKFFISLSAMLIAAKLLMVYSIAMEGIEKGFGTMQTVFIYDNKSFIAIALTVGIAVGLWFLEKKKPDFTVPKTVPYVILGVYAIAIAFLAGLFVRYSFIDTHSKLKGVMTFFRFDEKWGTHRGYMWIKGAEIFKNFNFIEMLFGSGPDTFYTVFSPYFGELSEKFNNTSTNCAHNEFLNYLVTTGILGLGAYLTLFGSAIVRAVKTAKKNSMAVVFIAPVVCYLFQSVVNIANPEVTPLLFIYLALSEAVVRSEKQAE